MVLGDFDDLSCLENGIHDLGISSHLLRVTRGKGFDFKVGKPAFNLRIR